MCGMGERKEHEHLVQPYCANEQGTQCVPQVCFEGARPPPFVAQPWVSLFASLSSSANVTEVVGPRPLLGFVSFGFKTCLPAVLLLLLGILLATLTFFCVCCHFWQCHFCGCGTWTFNPVSSAQKELPQKGTKQQAYRYTHPVALIIIVLLLCVVCMAGFIVRKKQWDKTSKDIDDEVTHLIKNLDGVLANLQHLNETGTTLNNKFEAMAHGCPWNPLMMKLGGLLHKATSSFVDNIVSTEATITELNEIVPSIPETMQTYRSLLVWIPLIPLLLVTVACLLMLVGVLCTRYCSNPSLHGTPTFHGLMTAGSLLLVGVMIVLILVVAVQLAFNVALSSICANIDDTTVQLAGAIKVHNSSIVSNIARFYIKGDIYNPLHQVLELAKVYFDEVVYFYKKIRWLFKASAISCHDMREIEMDNIAKEIKSVVHNVTKLLDAKNLYPYWKNTSQDIVCGRITGQLSVLILVQFIAGFLLFPLSICLAQRYLYKITPLRMFNGANRDLEREWEDEEDSEWEQDQEEDNEEEWEEDK